MLGGRARAALGFPAHGCSSASAVSGSRGWELEDGIIGIIIRALIFLVLGIDILLGGLFFSEPYLFFQLANFALDCYST
jgi:hypothetical protein